MRSWLVAAWIATLAVVASPVLAQQARGVVRDSLSQNPLAGAVVVVIDSSGATAARTIADGTGRFALALTGSSLRLHVIRIGYRPADIALPPASGRSSIAITMVRIPVLDVVHVASTELCPGSPDRGAAFQLWEQARAGLLASVVAREAKPAAMKTVTFRRSVWPNDDLVHDGVTEAHTTRTTQPFIAPAAPATFAARGYVAEESDGGRTYSAPDADVLLDPSFAETHCFHLQAADRGHPGQLGLAFTPIGGRDTLVDVNGVVWMDRATPALRTLEYRYTGLEPAADRSNLGGYIEFRTMPNGVAFIDYWMLRLPVMSQPDVVVSPAMSGFARRNAARSRRRQDRIDYRLTDISEAGGAVVDASWDDGTRWQPEPTALTGIIVQKGSGTPVPNAFVTLVGTSDTVTTDAMGRFTLSPLIPGRYTMAAVDTALRGYTPERMETKTVDVTRGQVTTVRGELASIASVLSALCRSQVSLPNSVTIVGQLSLDRGAQPQQGRSIYASWLAEVSVAEHQLAARRRDQTTTVDERGRFVLCGVAPDALVQIKLLDGRTVVRDTTVNAGRDAIVRMEWRAKP